MNHIVVSGYFNGRGHSRKRVYWEAVDRLLATRGFRIVLADWGPEPLETSCLKDVIPDFVMKAHNEDGARLLGEVELPDELLHAASIEAAIRGCPPEKVAVKALYYRAFMRNIIQRRKPCLWVMWHAFNSLHRAGADLCREIGLPILYAEYGVLPGSVCLETQGQMGESWVAREPQRFLALPAGEDALAAAEEYLEKVRAERRTRKVQIAEVDVAELSRSARRKGRKIVFYAGQNDYASGMAPRSLPESVLHSPHYGDTLDALNHLGQLADEHDWEVLFKPHPIVADRQLEFETPNPDRVKVVKGADIFDCMEQSDVTCTILSQVCYLALVHRRPCVLLGRTQLSGKGAVYEPTGRDDVGETFERAIREGVTEEKEKAWILHVAQSMLHYVFSMDDDLEGILPRGKDAAVKFILEHALDPKSAQALALGESARELWGRDESIVSGLESLRQRYRQGMESLTPDEDPHPSFRERIRRLLAGE